MATAYNLINIETLRKNANREYENKQYQYEFAFYLRCGFNQVPINIKEAFEYFKRASEQGHTGATAELGMLYYHGDGVKKNREKGIALLEQARAQGCARANCMLGHIYREEGSNYDLKKADEASRNAVQAFQKQCAEDKFDFKMMPAVVQHSLGFCYQNGEGIVKDVQQAVHCYRLAAKQGDAGAQYSLGLCYEKGEGVAQDFKQAVHCYELAAKQGFAWAQYSLGVCYEKGESVAQDFEKAVHYYELAARQGDAWAQYNLGFCYEKGEGVVQDLKKAVHYYELAAKQGNMAAQYSLARCYESGEGVAQDFKKAVHYYELAAKQGYVWAQHSLGFYYQNGRGVAQDFKKAVHYYRLAAEQGDAAAQYNLGVCYQNGEGVVKDVKEAVHYYTLAAEQGSEWAQYSLGVCYENGEGVVKDVKEAVHYYELAAKQGNELALYKLAWIYHGEGVKQDEKEESQNNRVDYYKKAAWLFYLAKESETSLANGGIPADDIEGFKQAMLFCKQITEEAKKHTNNEQTTEQKDAEKNKYSLSESIEKEIIKKYNYDQIRDFFESFNELGINSRTQTIENMQEMMNERFKNLSSAVASYLSEEFNAHKDVSNILFQYTGMMFDPNSKKMGLLKIKKQNKMSL